ncbi:MAG: LON peptidase substrate-binding domain-containing protein, partial [Clostridia bacterium]|nr:LON peptidase substrate-binding domain-containing protein [Clostridia bacterium]
MSSNHSETNDKMLLPLIPIRGNVVFPAIQTTLEISRPLSLKAFSVSAASDGIVFLTAQKDPAVESPEERDLYKIGTVAVIKHVARTPDSTLSITFEGKCRARLCGVIPDEDYLHASVILCPSKPEEFDSPDQNHLASLKNEIFKRLDSLRQNHPAVTDEFYNSAKALNSNGFLCDFIASSILIVQRNKQKILECQNPYLRLERLLSILDEEEKLIRFEHDVHRRVKENLEEHQKEYYLREQVKILQQELGEDEDEIEEYAGRIERSGADSSVKEKLTKELNKLAKTPFGAAESA